MITCSTRWNSLALIVEFLDHTYITLHSPESQMEFATDCGVLLSGWDDVPSDDDCLEETADSLTEITECPYYWRRGAA